MSSQKVLGLDLAKATLPDAIAVMLDAWLKAQGMDQTTTHPCTLQILEPLSEREIQVLSFVARGDSNCEIGQQLHISVDTVKTHISKVCRKMQARDRTHAAVLGFRWGVLS